MYMCMVHGSMIFTSSQLYMILEAHIGLLGRRSENVWRIGEKYNNSNIWVCLKMEQFHNPSLFVILPRYNLGKIY